MDISENALNTIFVTSVNSYTNKIEELMTELYHYSEYEYAFCDNEAEIKCSPNEFKNIKESVYSLTVVPVNKANDNVLNVIRSKWNIDGFTTRIFK